MATKKVTKESKHEPTTTFDWQLYAEELERECERLKRTIEIMSDQSNRDDEIISSRDKAIKHLILAMSYMGELNDE
jgi:hypothetical protein